MFSKDLKKFQSAGQVGTLSLGSRTVAALAGGGTKAEAEGVQSAGPSFLLPCAPTWVVSRKWLERTALSAGKYKYTKEKRTNPDLYC